MTADTSPDGPNQRERSRAENWIVYARMKTHRPYRADAKASTPDRLRKQPSS